MNMRIYLTYLHDFIYNELRCSSNVGNEALYTILMVNVYEVAKFQIIQTTSD